MKGSYTVEAALLAGILMPLLCAVIYMGFFLHDRGFVQAAAHEAAALGSLHGDDDTDLSGVANRLTAGRMLASKGVAGTLSGGEREVRAEYQGTFCVPGILQRLWGGQNASVGAQVVLSAQRPSRRISKIRGLAKVTKGIRERVFE